VFHIDPHNLDANNCPCCGGSHEVYQTLDEMAFDCTALTLNRLKGEEIVTRAQLANRDDVNFLEMELAASLALAEDALSLVPRVEDIILPHLKEDLRADQVYDAMDRANSLWRNESFKEETSTKWEEAIALALAVGVVTANDAVFVPREFRTGMINGMNRAAKYYTNEFFNTQVMPSLYGAVDRVLYGDQTGAKAAFTLVRETLDKRLKSVPYWNVVANAATSRSYHYGMLRAGQFAGKSSFRYVAVMDKRTSDICTNMNGREWTISVGLNLMQRVINAEHPEDLKTITPWMKYQDMKNLDESALAEAGVIVPPLHGRCRSTIALI
jgi:hypothetical protein